MLAGSDAKWNAAGIPSCASCTPNECLFRRYLESLVEMPLHVSYETMTTPRGHRLQVEKTSKDKLSVVVDGMVMLESSLPDGRRQVTGFCTAGEVLSAGNRCEPLSYDMTAMQPTRLCQVRLNGGGLPGRLTRVLLEMARYRLASAERHLILLARLTSREKVACFLLEMATRIGCRAAAGIRVELPMNRDVIADYLGLNAETVSRRFTDLKQFGVIDLPRPGLVLIADLEKLAAQTPLVRFTIPRLPIRAVDGAAREADRAPAPAKVAV